MYPLEMFLQNMSSEVATFKGTPFHFQAIKPSLDPVLLFFLGPLLCPWSPVIELSFITSSSTVLCFVRNCLRRFGPSYPHVWSGHFFTEWWPLFFFNFSSLVVSPGFVSLCLSSSCWLLMLFSSSVWHTSMNPAPKNQVSKAQPIWLNQNRLLF